MGFIVKQLVSSILFALLLTVTMHSELIVTGLLSCPCETEQPCEPVDGCSECYTVHNFSDSQYTLKQTEFSKFVDIVLLPSIEFRPGSALKNNSLILWETPDLPVPVHLQYLVQGIPIRGPSIV